MKRTFSTFAHEGGEGREKENRLVKSEKSLGAFAPTCFDFSAFAVIAVQASAKVKCEIDLQRLARKADNAEFKRASTVLRIRKPFTTCRVTVKGCLGVTGARSIEDAEEAMLRFARIIRNAGHPEIASIFGFHVTTMSAGARFPRGIMLFKLLEELHKDLRFHADWNPDATPNLHCRMKVLGVTVSVSAKGYVKVDGATSKDTIFKALACIHPFLVACHVAM